MYGAAIRADNMPRRAASPGAPAPSEMNALLARVAAHSDREAFARVYSFFAPRVKGYFMRLGCAPSEAEDLAQETLARVWRKASLFEPDKASVSTWIFTIARNIRIDAIRRTRRTDASEPGASDDSDPAPGAEADLERAERDSRIRDAFNALPPNQYQVVALHFYGDEPHSSIAKKLGLPLGTVKSRLRLALGRIRRELGDLR